MSIKTVDQTDPAFEGRKKDMQYLADNQGWQTREEFIHGMALVVRTVEIDWKSTCDQALEDTRKQYGQSLRSSGESLKLAIEVTNYCRWITENMDLGNYEAVLMNHIKKFEDSLK